MQNITREQADIIGEVANICTGNAATTLSMILKVLIPLIIIIIGLSLIFKDTIIK